MTARSDTLTGVLQHRAEASPNKVAVRHVASSGDDACITYGRLLDEATGFAGALRASGVRPGDRVVVMLPTSIEFVVTLYGTLLAGGVPTPAYPPVSMRRLDAYLGTLDAILRQATPAVVLVPDEMAALAASLPPGFEQWTQRMRTFTSVAQEARDAPQVPVQADDLALIQYSSGSTGTPKGIALTHANLIANLRGIGERFGFTADDTGVCWLPLYHDMGLIGFVMGGLVTGPEIVLVSPFDFLLHPSRWFELLSRHRGTISGGPQFGFSLAVERVSEESLVGLDLSAVRLLLVGAEPIVPEVLRRFAAKFARVGLAADTLVPCYGLAENSLAVSFAAARPEGPRTLAVSRTALASSGVGRPAVEPADVVELVSCGRPIAGTEVRILRADGTPAGPGEVGEIWVSGTSACRHVFARPDLERDLFDGPWVRTGDLGFRVEGDLYVTGRCKDVIIVAGRNLYPQDLEHAVTAVPGLRPGRVAAVGVPHVARGTEQITIVAEVSAGVDAATLQALPTTIRRVLASTCGIEASEVFLAEKGEIPVTSSGKLRRHALREALLARRLVPYGGSTP